MTLTIPCDCHLNHAECEGYLIGQAKPYQSRDKKSHDDRANVITIYGQWQRYVGMNNHCGDGH